MAAPLRRARVQGLLEPTDNARRVKGMGAGRKTREEPALDKFLTNDRARLRIRSQLTRRAYSHRGVTQ
jgi:hypothetical protein